MTPTEYRDRNNARARGTNPTLPPEMSRLALYALGIAGETGELIAADKSGNPEEVLLELGDLLWYVDRLCQAADLDLLNVWDWRPTWTALAPPHVAVAAGVIADLVKKFLFHQRPLAGLTLELRWLAAGMQRTAASYGLGLEAIMAANTAKLDARHPNGWDPSYHQRQENG